jgi:hypothetical protein
LGVVGQEKGAARVSKRVFEIYSMQMLKYKILYARLLTRAALFVSLCRWHHNLSNWIRNRKNMRYCAGRPRSMGPIVGPLVKDQNPPQRRASRERSDQVLSVRYRNRYRYRLFRHACSISLLPSSFGIGVDIGIHFSGGLIFDTDADTDTDTDFDGGKKHPAED